VRKASSLLSVLATFEVFESHFCFNCFSIISLCFHPSSTRYGVPQDCPRFSFLIIWFVAQWPTSSTPRLNHMAYFVHCYGRQYVASSPLSFADVAVELT
jgi:hypothetical protein